MSVLYKIILNKLKEVEEQKELVSIAQLQASPLYRFTPPSLKTFLLDKTKTGIIAEHKRQSPSAGVINDKVNVEDVALGYENAAVSGISILTDSVFFGGKNDDLIAARKVVNTPILRKDFIIDSYQVHEAKAIGASAILLIAACLEKEKAKELAELAKDIGLDVLMEIHEAEEIKIINKFVDIVGVNNRNLSTFEVSLETSAELARKIPSKYVKISESGIYKTEDIEYLKTFGYQGFLIGENFMRTDNPGEACAQFSKKLKPRN
ncbi:MAG: indole-3-glycerol phosphate synthase TrpC [Breznakibacter sp.]|nr:indole-3-glycerol phosphate synthase TrpC [Breznakibacter sp.]